MESKTVLRLKVTDASADLMEIAEACRKARNVGITDWLLRQHGKPESPKQARSGRTKDKNGNPKLLTESTKIYHAITAGVPELSTTQASCIGREIQSYLNGEVDWRKGKTEDGKRPRRRDAVLNYTDRPPFFTAMEIPLHNKHMKLQIGDTLSIVVNSPIRSRQKLIVELSLRDIPRGVQRMLREIMLGKIKLSCSKLLYKARKNAWYWHLTVTTEKEPLSEEKSHLYAVIGAPRGKQADRPFCLKTPTRSWYAGDGRYLLSSVQRLVALRKQIGWRYRLRQGAGHGRQKVDTAVKRRREQEHNVRNEFRRRLILDIVNQCERANTGVLVYYEPSLPLRPKCWFETVKLEFDWTRFRTDLSNAAARRGIELVVKRYEWKDAQKDGFLPKKQEAAA